jgi:hypothetical protein
MQLLHLGVVLIACQSALCLGQRPIDCSVVNVDSKAVGKSRRGKSNGVLFKLFQGGFGWSDAAICGSAYQPLSGCFGLLAGILFYKQRPLKWAMARVGNTDAD